jgi:metal-responsive CopG/Arc/MetJ family transcriptional regulator
MKIDYADTVSVHLNLPRQLVQELDLRRNRHNTRTIQIIRAVEAYLASMEASETPKSTPTSTWSIFG